MEQKIYFSNRGAGKRYDSYARTSKEKVLPLKSFALVIRFFFPVTVP